MAGKNSNKQYRGKRGTKYGKTEHAKDNNKSKRSSSNDRTNDRADETQRGNYRRSNQSGLSSAPNDISWYSRYPELLAAAGQVQYPWRPGMFLPMGSTIYDSKTHPIQYAVPGVMGIRWAPNLGYSESVSSPISITSKEIYSRVRAAFSGSLEADPPDFIIYMMALDSIFSYIAYLKRLYRVTNAYDPQNLAIPTSLLLALLDVTTTTNLTPSPEVVLTQLQSSKMKLYGIINELIHMTEKFRCPSVMDVFNRHYWLNDNVYTDAPSVNSQLYVFHQTYFYKFSLQNTPEGIAAGGLEMVSEPSFSAADGDSLVDNLFSFGKSLIDALASSDDAYTISGYLMRAFEGTPSFTVDLLSYDEKLELKYDEEVLMQIENIVAIPDFSKYQTAVTAGKMNVSQDPKTNTIINRPQVQWPTTGNKGDWYTYFQSMPMLNSVRKEMPTVADTVISTRLKTWLVAAGSAETFNVMGATEVVLGIWTTWLRKNESTGALTYDWRLVSQFVSIDSSTTVGSFNSGFLFASAFDWTPAVYVMYRAGSLCDLRPIWDVHNVTVLPPHELENINKVCLYSEFNAFTV